MRQENIPTLTMTKENIPTLSFETGKYPYTNNDKGKHPYTKKWQRKTTLHQEMTKENIATLRNDKG